MTVTNTPYPIRTVTKIVTFYSDGTFTEYTPSPIPAPIPAPMPYTPAPMPPYNPFWGPVTYSTTYSTGTPNSGVSSEEC